MLTFIFSAGEYWCHLPTLCPEKRKRRFVSSGWKLFSKPICWCRFATFPNFFRQNVYVTISEMHLNLLCIQSQQIKFLIVFLVHLSLRHRLDRWHNFTSTNHKNVIVSDGWVSGVFNLCPAYSFTRPSVFPAGRNSNLVGAWTSEAGLILVCQIQILYNNFFFGYQKKYCVQCG